MSRYVLAIDAGHGGCKCFLLDADEGTHYISYEKWTYFSRDNDPLSKEFSPSDFFNIISTNVRNVIKKSKINPKDVRGISTTSMRHSFVFLDKNGNELYAGPNTDARGAHVQDIFEEKIDFDVYKTTGQWPPLMFLPTKLLWFKEEQHEIFEKIKYALTMNDWMIYKLCNVFATDLSQASATMLLDIKKRTWILEILKTLGMFTIELPAIYPSGTIVGELSENIAKKMHLVKNTPIIMGGADSQLGLIACSAIEKGQIASIAGTSAPVMMVSSEPIVDNKRRVWTGCHVVPDKWVIEGNPQVSGLTYKWLKTVFNKIKQRDDKTIYKIMEEMASTVPPGSDDVYAFLGSEIMDVSNISVIRPGMFMFQQPAHPLNTCPPSFEHFIRATLENIAYAIRGNIEQLEDVMNEKPDNIRLTGKMSENTLWLQMLSNITEKKVLATRFGDGTSFGCAMCATVGLDIHKNMNEAARDFNSIKLEFIPNEHVQKIYNSCYNRWKEIYYNMIT